MTLIQCCNLSLGYEGKCVLSHLELSVQEGDYLAIVGENGAGKSTLLKGILGPPHRRAYSLPPAT